MADRVPPQLFQLEIASTVAETRRLHAWLDDSLARLSVHGKLEHAMRLCIEEAVMNVILHGYGAQASGTIEIEISPEPPGLLARIADAAPRFDPTEAAERPSAAGLASGPVGGHGIALMRRYADTLHYERTQGRNRLTLGFSV